jgi:hypothetical protein
MPPVFTAMQHDTRFCPLPLRAERRLTKPRLRRAIFDYSRCFTSLQRKMIAPHVSSAISLISGAGHAYSFRYDYRAFRRDSLSYRFPAYL